MKEKISISVDKDMLEKIDSFIDNQDIRNRSQAFEYLIRKTLKKDVKKAVILAGGEKEKLRYGKTFKPLVKVNGKEVILHTIDVLRRYKINELIVCAGSLNDEIARMINDNGLKISYIKDNNIGTAGVLKQAKKYLNKEDFFVVSGDIWFDFGLDKMMAFHNTHNEPVTISISTTKLQESKDRLELEGNKIVRFDYAPRIKTFTVNAGVYILRPDILDMLPARGSLEKDVFPKLARAGKIVAYNFSGSWRHIS